MDTTDTTEITCDVAIVGGGTAGTMAAITAAEHGATVLLLEKAHVRHSGALAMGMDGVNNAVIPGKATPEEYVAEITRANDGIVNQRAVYQTASRGHDMVRRLERYGVKFAKDAQGEYDVRRVHRSGSYVLPMPEGRDVKKVLYRVLRTRHIREKVRIENRVMPVRVLTEGGQPGARAVGLAGFNTRTGEFVTVHAKAVVLTTGACGRLGLPASGYLYGTYENPTNAGDGHAMAYHAGAELSGLECFQIRIERRLHVDDEISRLGHVNDEVGSQRAVFARYRKLFGEVAMLGHSREFNEPAERQLAPTPAHLGTA